MKVDISKAFNTLDWGFLLQLLKFYGFNCKITIWISEILKYAKVFISVNGNLCEFFDYGRGMRQADPLSPLLLFIVEYVLSRSILNLFSRNFL